MECGYRVCFCKRDGKWTAHFKELVDSPSCMEAGGGEPRAEHCSPRATSQARDSSPPGSPLVSNGDVAHRKVADTLPTDMSESSESEPDNEHNGGECEKCTNPHDGKLIMQQEFAFNIDQMFTMIFTESEFNTELMAARNTLDYRQLLPATYIAQNQSPWQAQNDLKCRQISYTLRVTSGPIGATEVHITETQVMNKCSKPGALYSIDCTSDNAGIPFEDYFSVCVHYCLQRVTHSTTMLSFYGQVKYKKTMLFFKTPLENHSINGLDKFCRLLESKLNVEAETAVFTARKTRRCHRRRTASSQEPVSSAPRALDSAVPTSLVQHAPVPRAILPTLYWLLAMVLVVLAITCHHTSVLYWD